MRRGGQVVPVEVDGYQYLVWQEAPDHARADRLASKLAPLKALDAQLGRYAGVRLKDWVTRPRGDRRHSTERGEMLAEVANWTAAALKGDDMSMMVLSGPAGTGKTMLACAAARAMAWQRRSVMFVDGDTMFDRVRATFSKSSERSKMDVLNEYFNVDVLLIDDLGTQSGSAFDVTELAKVINHRHRHRKITIATTNCDSWADLMQAGGSPEMREKAARSASRAQEMCAWLSTDGWPDLRPIASQLRQEVAS